ncbi:MAG: hypothetical protein EXR21_02505 [Flavobacteriaceae bacterium]|nr:hypothetical protein [Flavobacteriaceae bacterium]
MNIKQNTLMLAGLLIFASCKEKEPVITDPNMPKKVLTDLPSKVFTENMFDLSSKAGALYRSVETLVQASNDVNLAAAQKDWYETRKAWEQSEAFLFGPVADKGYDPAIDSWPVNFVEIDSVLNSSSAFSDAYIIGLGNTLKGFHPIEYMLFSTGKSRKAADLTQRQKDYLFALTKNLWYTTQEMYNSWATAGGNFIGQMQQAGTGTSTYKTRKDAFIEIANAATGIVDEVSAAKIGEPFTAQDSMLEESPFSSNSWADFTNNLQGVKNVYFGTYSQDGLGLHDFVTLHDKSLDLKIQQKLDAAINSLKAYTTRFGKAIFTEPAAVQSTQTVLNDLKTVLEDELVPLIQLKVID